MERLLIVWTGFVGGGDICLGSDAAVGVSSATVWFRAAWRTLQMRSETSLMVVGTSGVLYWDGAA